MDFGFIISFTTFNLGGGNEEAELCGQQKSASSKLPYKPGHLKCRVLSLDSTYLSLSNLVFKLNLSPNGMVFVSVWGPLCLNRVAL